MTTEAVTLTDEQIDRLGHWLSECLDDAAPLNERAWRNKAEWMVKGPTFQAVLSDLLAGAGAQVTEAAVEAAVEAMGPSRDCECTLDSDTCNVCYATVRAALSAALPHMGTGQAEADLARICDQYGLPHSVAGLHRHLVNNAEAVNQVNAATIKHLDEQLADLRARISALADEWLQEAAVSVRQQFSEETTDEQAERLRRRAMQFKAQSERVRALLDRPAAAEGNET